MFALHSLHPGQLIPTEGAFPVLRSLRGVGIDLTALADLLVALGVGDLVEPVAEVVRLEAPFFSSRAACRGEICSMMPRAITSSAISRPVHCLMRRPAFI